MVMNIAHRGASGIEPENTLRAFRRAEREGADAVEFDLRVALDGDLIVMHDPDVLRTTGRGGLVSEMTSSELAGLDAGLGEPVPTFVEASRSTGLELYAEMKVRQAVEPLCRLLAGGGDLTSRITLISFDHGALEEARSLLPEVRLGLISREPSLRDLGWAREVGVGLISVWAPALEDDFVTGCHGLGISVTAWTVNDPSDMRRLIGCGVDGVVTDHPEVLGRILRGG